MKNIFTILFFTALIFNAPAQTKNAQISALYQNYLSIKNALASDQFENASKAASQFIKTAGIINDKLISKENSNALKKNASAISGAKTIQKQREFFNNLSENMIALTKKYKLDNKSVYLQYCPMAEGNWLSSEPKIVNPYYGSKMLSCGSVKSEIK